MRWLEPEITVAALAEPVSLEEAKAHLRLEADDTDEDALITALVAAARGHVEQYTGLKLYTQTVKLRAWGFEDCTFRLPMAPVQSISGVTYVDADGATQTLDPAVYVSALYGLSPTVAKAYDQVWPAHRCGLGNVVFTVVAGYAADACPAPIKQALLLILGDLYANRETVTLGQAASIPLSATVEALLANSRRSYV